MKDPAGKPQGTVVKGDGGKAAGLRAVIRSDVFLLLCHLLSAFQVLLSGQYFRNDMGTELLA